MKFVIPAFAMLLSLNALAWDQTKTEAASALDVLKKHRESASNNMPLTVEEGADISYVCLALQYKGWGEPIYQSIFANKNAIVPVQMSEYVNFIDKMEKSFQIVEASREGLVTLVNENIKKFQVDRIFPSVPEGLNFSNFKNESNNYLTALNFCGDQGFLDTVLAQLENIDSNSMVNGGFAVTPASQVNLGYINTAPSGSAMCSGPCKPQPTIIEVTEKSPLFNRTKSYESWINTFARM